MRIAAHLKQNKLLTAVVLIYVLLFIGMPDRALQSVKNSIYYVVEMLQVMPVVFILTSILETWVPKEIITNGFGEKAGIRGSIFSFLLGSLSAGPVYAAFPISKMLLKKGASVTNIVIILSTWAVVKVPMLANEAKFLGIRFMIIRWTLTTIAIFIMAYLTAMIVKKENIPTSDAKDNLNHGIINFDAKYCIGCGICVKTCPENFLMQDKKARLITDQINYDDINHITKAVEKCPAKAIVMNCQS